MNDKEAIRRTKKFVTHFYLTQRELGYNRIRSMIMTLKFAWKLSEKHILENSEIKILPAKIVANDLLPEIGTFRAQCQANSPGAFYYWLQTHIERRLEEIQK